MIWTFGLTACSPTDPQKPDVVKDQDKPPKIAQLVDDWQYNSETLKEDGSFSSVSKSAARPMMTQSAMAPVGGAANLGFAVGGAKDVNNFRDNIKNNYLPIPTDITYEGLFYNYFFDTGKQEECQKLFCPSYSTAVSKDPLSQKPEYYLSVGLNSGIKEADFKRKKLNLVVVMDISGSMGSPFDKYYYDRFGNKVELKDEESA